MNCWQQVFGWLPCSAGAFTLVPSLHKDYDIRDRRSIIFNVRLKRWPRFWCWRKKICISVLCEIHEQFRSLIDSCLTAAVVVNQYTVWRFWWGDIDKMTNNRRGYWSASLQWIDIKLASSKARSTISTEHGSMKTVIKSWPGNVPCELSTERDNFFVVVDNWQSST